MSARPTPEQELHLIEVSIEHAQGIVDMANALRRLCDNDDFKKVFLDHYMVNEASRTVRMLAEPSQQGQKEQDALQKQLIGIGQFDQFMRCTLSMGDMAAQGIEEDKAAYNSILEEESEA